MIKLRVPLTKEERKERYGVTAISFEVNEQGGFIITEEWDHPDELYSSAVRISVPPRIWHEAVSVLFAGAST